MRAIPSRLKAIGEHLEHRGEADAEIVDSERGWAYLTLMGALKALGLCTHSTIPEGHCGGPPLDTPRLLAELIEQMHTADEAPPRLVEGMAKMSYDELQLFLAYANEPATPGWEAEPLDPGWERATRLDPGRLEAALRRRIELFGMPKEKWGWIEALCAAGPEMRGMSSIDPERRARWDARRRDA